jgi:hypothetical protein
VHGHIVAQRLTKAARFKKVALQDDNRGGAIGINRKRSRLGLKSDIRHQALRPRYRHRQRAGEIEASAGGCVDGTRSLYSLCFSVIDDD